MGSRCGLTGDEGRASRQGTLLARPSVPSSALLPGRPRAALLRGQGLAFSFLKFMRSPEQYQARRRSSLSVPRWNPVLLLLVALVLGGVLRAGRCRRVGS